MPLPNAPTKLATILDKKELSSKKNLSNSNKKNRKTTKNSFSKISTNVRSKEPNIISPRIQTKKLKKSQKNQLNKTPQSKNNKLFVLDTNVLMHDPTSLFRFQEHDIYIPMVTLEELDEHKTGMSEVSRNVRQVTRSIDSLIGASLEETVKKLNLGVPLNSLGHSDATGSLFFQTEKLEINISLGLEVEKPDNQILGIVKKLVEK